MKVFLGWSGDTSNKVATALHGWLPKVIQSVKPYISSEDIAKGARWSSEIAKELQSSNFGIICITKENLNSQWIHFESGALSREIEKSYVTPFLFNLQPSDIQGSPLHQFQSVMTGKDEIRKLLESINKRQDGDHALESNRLTEGFKMWWPHLQTELDTIARDETANTPTPKPLDVRVILEELLRVTQTKERSDNVQWAEFRETLAEERYQMERRFSEFSSMLGAVLNRLSANADGTLQSAFAITDGQNRMRALDVLGRIARPSDEETLKAQGLIESKRQSKRVLGRA